MKNILFLNTTKLAVALKRTLMVLTLCIISALCIQAEESTIEPSDSIAVTGPKKSHWTAGIFIFKKYHNEHDFAQVKAVVKVYDREGIDITDEVDIARIGEVSLAHVTDNGAKGTVETISPAGSSAYINWKCGIPESENSDQTAALVAAHKLHVKLTAALVGENKDYVFAGWSTNQTNKDYDKGTNTTFDHTSNIANGGSGYGSYASKQNDQYEGSTRYTETFYAKFVPVTPTKVTLAVAENGTYYYSTSEDSGDVIDSEAQIDSKERVSLTATSKSGYKFFGWYTKKENQDIYFSYDSVSTSPALTQDTTIYAKFIPADWATYIVKGEDKRYFEFDKAEAAAESSSSKVFLPITDGIVPYKEGGYSIHSGVTLLIPYEGTYKTVKKNVEYAIDATFSSANCTTYVVLTLAKGTTITVKGNIEVAAKLVSKGQSSTINSGNNGAIYQTYGEIIMSAGSCINLENGAYLYAWGRITGSEYSKINAYEGSTVYESFQITDFQGGTKTKAMYQDRTTYKIFPFSQYYIQNIETPIRFEYGSKEYTNAMLTVQSTTEAPIKDLPIIGNGGALFNINSKDSYVEKRYDAVNDRQVYKIGGTTSVDNFNTSIKILTDLDINTKDYLLPFTNNIVAHIESGELTINANLIMNADNKIVVADGAKIKIPAQKNLFVYDQDDWKTGFVFANPPNTAVAPLCYTIPYATTTGKPATVSGGKFTANPPIRTTVEDATLQVDGELIVNGNLYVSPGLANICSTGAGKVTFPNGNTCSETYIVHHLNTLTETSNIVYARIAETYETSFIPAQLHNDTTRYPSSPDNYTQTSGAEAGAEFVYSQYYGKWLKNPKVITWDATTNGGTCETPQTVLPQQETKVPELPIATKTGYTFNGWFTAASGGTQITKDSIVNDNVTYYAQWTLNTEGTPLDIVDADNTKDSLTINTNGWASSGWPYTINGVKYKKGDREADRTLVIPYGDKDPDEEIVIEVKDTVGTVVSRHMYKVPFVYTGTEEMSDMNENSIVFVKSDTLSIDGTASAKEIYVAPGAELKVNGELDVEKLVLRTTPWQAAVLTIGTGGSIELAEGGQVYYSRIAPNKSTIKDLQNTEIEYNSAQYYQFGLPLSCPISSVTMSNAGKLGGSQPKYRTAWMLKSYNEKSRANNGIKDDGANWDLLPSEGTIAAGVGYEMFSNSNYYREFYFPVDLTTATNQVRVQYTKGTKEEHNGWNIITSPLTSRANVPIIDPATDFKVCWLNEDGSYRQELPTVFPPAIPFSIQASAEGKLNFAVPTIAAAPRKQSAAEALTETEWVHLDIFDAYGEGDETSLFVHPTRFEQTYKTGIDMAKQSLTASRPIIYSTHAYGDMAFAGVADSLLENGIDIAVYSPSAQQLTFSLRENKFLNRLEYLWLADNETGERTDLLMDDYTCRANAGTIKGRFVLNGRFKAPQITTNIDNIHTDYTIYAIGNNIAISGVEQGTPIYVFDAVGHMIYTTAATSDEVIVPAPCAGVYMLTIGGQTAKLVVNQ